MDINYKDSTAALTVASQVLSSMVSYIAGHLSITADYCRREITMITTTTTTTTTTYSRTWTGMSMSSRQPNLTHTSTQTPIIWELAQIPSSFGRTSTAIISLTLLSTSSPLQVRPLYLSQCSCIDICFVQRLWLTLNVPSREAALQFRNTAMLLPTSQQERLWCFGRGRRSRYCCSGGYP